jgi:hypothetical protein
MSIGTIGFNVINSISDAICFDVIGKLTQLVEFSSNHNFQEKMAIMENKESGELWDSV